MRFEPKNNKVNQPPYDLRLVWFKFWEWNGILDFWRAFLLAFRILCQCLDPIRIILTWNVELPLYNWFKREYE